MLSDPLFDDSQHVPVEYVSLPKFSNDFGIWQQESLFVLCIGIQFKKNSQKHRWY